jgi:hypothetical protein
MFTGIAACCGAAVALICGTPQPERSPPEHALERQKFDALPAQAISVAVQTRARDSSPSNAVRLQSVADELDALSAPFDLSLTQIIALESGEPVQIRLPSARAIVLEPIAVRSRHGMQTTTARADALVSTITRRGRHFYATVASSDASYRVIGDGARATALSQRALAARSAYVEQDFQYVR